MRQHVRRTALLALAVALATACAHTSAQEPDLGRDLRLPTRTEVCALPEADARLCQALERLESSALGAAPALHAPLLGHARRVARRDLGDPALRYFLRERIVGLLAWYTLAEDGEPPRDPTTYAGRVTGLLARFYPNQFGSGQPRPVFRVARIRLAPDPRCPGPARARLLLFPGVARVGGEFAAPIETVPDTLPCLELRLVETGTFLTPQENAKVGCQALNEAARDHPSGWLHLAGYSQGGRNALETLLTADCQGAVPQVRTVVGINSAAHGSPVADAFALLFGSGAKGSRCAGLRGFAGWWCNRPRPLWILRAPLKAFSPIPMDDPEFRRREKLDEDATLGDLIRDRHPGIYSLSTYASSDFWRERGKELPQEPLYLSFRSIVTDTKRNLPDSNRAFYHLNFKAGGAHPWTDMQVRLVGQQWGGPLIGREVLGPAAEGNHWQWTMEPDQIPEAIMPERMFAGFPRTALFLAHYVALAEVGGLAPR